MYEPLEVVKCEKCGKVIAEPKELIRIQKVWSNFYVDDLKIIVRSSHVGSIGKKSQRDS